MVQKCHEWIYSTLDKVIQELDQMLAYCYCTDMNAFSPAILT